MDVTKVLNALQSRGFKTAYFDTKEQAVTYLAQETVGKTVSFGGSVTLEQMNAYEVVGKTANVHWHWKNDGIVQGSEVYVSSVNALSETGEIVNIDGVGNRVAGTLYGSKQVFFVCGINKIVPNLTDALDRAQNIAAPKNALRLNRYTPCAKVGGEKCFNCNSDENICRATVIIHKPMMGTKRYEVVIVGEELGY